MQRRKSDNVPGNDHKGMRGSSSVHLEIQHATREARRLPSNAWSILLKLKIHLIFNIVCTFKVRDSCMYMCIGHLFNQN